jgi:hypothetical protein
MEAPERIWAWIAHMEDGRLAGVWRSWHAGYSRDATEYTPAARLAEVERARETYRLQANGLAVRVAAAEARAERLEAALRHIEARLPAWRDAMSDWDAGGETALYEMDEAQEIIAAALQQEGGE